MSTGRTYAGPEPGTFEELFDASVMGMALLDLGELRVRRANAAFSLLVEEAGNGAGDNMVGELCRAFARESAPTIRQMACRAGEGPAMLRITAWPLPGQAGVLACCVERVAVRAEEIPPPDLMIEAQHRIRNCLAVLRSIFARTVHHSSSVDELAAHFLGRLDAFSRVQSNLLLHDRHGLGLYELVLDELALQGADASVGMSGPEVRLRVKAAETFSLAVHELAVNSVKYGVLGPRTGQINIAWDIVPSGAGEVLKFSWSEEGSEYLPHPLHRGFGTEMLTQTAAFELGGEVEVRYRSDGVSWAMCVPVTDWLLVRG